MFKRLFNKEKKYKFKAGDVNQGTVSLGTVNAEELVANMIDLTERYAKEGKNLYLNKFETHYSNDKEEYTTVGLATEESILERHRNDKLAHIEHMIRSHINESELFEERLFKVSVDNINLGYYTNLGHAQLRKKQVQRHINNSDIDFSLKDKIEIEEINDIDNFKLGRDLESRLLEG